MISLAWTISPAAASYTVLRGSVSGIWGTVIGTTTENSIVDDTTEPSTTYYYQVVATNNTGSVFAVQEISARTPAPPIPPNPPTDLLWVNSGDPCSEFTSPQENTFSWTLNSSDETNLVLQMSTDDTNWTTIDDTIPAGSVTTTNLFQVWDTLYIRVGAEDPSGIGWSDSIFIDWNNTCNIG